MGARLIALQRFLFDIPPLNNNKLVSPWALVHACADPESFVRGVPTLTTFFFFSLMRGGITDCSGNSV